MYVVIWEWNVKSSDFNLSLTWRLIVRWAPKSVSELRGWWREDWETVSWTLSRSALWWDEVSPIMERLVFQYSLLYMMEYCMGCSCFSQGKSSGYWRKGPGGQMIHHVSSAGASLGYYFRKEGRVHFLGVDGKCNNLGCAHLVLRGTCLWLWRLILNI